MPNFIAADSYGQWTGLAQNADQQAAANYFRQLEAARLAQQYAAQMATQEREAQLNRAMATRQMAERKSEADRAYAFQKNQFEKELDLRNRELGMRSRQMEIAANPYQYNWGAFKYADELARSGEADPETLGRSFGLEPKLVDVLKASAREAEREKEQEFEQQKSIIGRLNELADIPRQRAGLQAYRAQPGKRWLNPFSWGRPGKLPTGQLSAYESRLKQRKEELDAWRGSLPKGYAEQLPILESGDYAPPRDWRRPAVIDVQATTVPTPPPIKFDANLRQRRIDRFVELKALGMSPLEAKKRVLAEMPLENPTPR